MLRFVSFIVAILNVSVIAWSVLNEHPLYFTNIGNTAQISIYLAWNLLSLALLLSLLGDADRIGPGVVYLTSTACWAFTAYLGGIILYILFAKYPYVTNELGTANGVVLGIVTYTMLIICSFCYEKKPTR